MSEQLLSPEVPGNDDLHNELQVAAHALAMQAQEATRVTDDGRRSGSDAQPRSASRHSRRSAKKSVVDDSPSIDVDGTTFVVLPGGPVYVNADELRRT